MNWNNSVTEPLNPPPETTTRKASKFCGKCCCATFWVIFILVWIVQGCCYWYGLNFGCNAKSLEGYTYPGAQAGEKFTKEENLVPRIALLAERDPSRYGASFDVIPSNDASSVSEAPVGVWWATWGPLFTTYIYEDVHASKSIIYMRRNMLRLGMSHRIGRCDGKGNDYTLFEGTLWFNNRIRHLFGLNQAYTFKLYDGDTFVGLVQETNKGTPSLTVSDQDGDELGSAVLQQRHWHGDKDLWLTKTHAQTIPFYVTESIAALYSFSMLGAKQRAAKKDVAKPAYDYEEDEQKATAQQNLLLFAKDDATIFANTSEPVVELHVAEDSLELNSKDDANKEKVLLEHV